MELERIDIWPMMTKEGREAKMIQRTEDSNVLENKRRRKRKESDQKMNQSEQADICSCKVKLNMRLVPNR